MKEKISRVGYQFTPMPKQLMHLLDVNLRSMLFALVDASNYFADEDGWFFRTNEQLRLDSDLSTNLVIATIDTLFQHSLIEVSCSGKGKKRKPNNYKLNLDLFKFFEQLDMNTDLYRPENKIETVKYKGSGYHASYIDDEPVRYLPELVKGKINWKSTKPTLESTPGDTNTSTKELTTKVTKSEHNIYNIDSIYNKEYINIKDNIDSDNNNIYTNNILKENSDIDTEELEREMEKGVTEPNSKNEGKEYPNQSQVNNISSGKDQDCISGEVLDEGVKGVVSSQSQSSENEPRPTNHKQLQDYFHKRFRQEFKEKIPESESDIEKSKVRLYQELESFSDIPDYKLVGYVIKNACEKETDRLMRRILAT